MEKITSFTIDHIKLQPGIYVSRKDPVGGSMITTFDIRMTSPNEEPVMNTAELHTIEHLAATFLRNHKEFGSKMIYWGPMGCLTGNYLLIKGDLESKDIVELMKRTFKFIADFEGHLKRPYISHYFVIRAYTVKTKTAGGFLGLQYSMN